MICGERADDLAHLADGDIVAERRRRSRISTPVIALPQDLSRSGTCSS